MGIYDAINRNTEYELGPTHVKLQMVEDIYGY